MKMATKQQLELLADAISDVGYWTWWVSDFPKIFQIEFSGTQLYLAKDNLSKLPSSQIALRFINPKSVSFLTKGENYSNDDVNWFNDLYNDKLEKPTCSYEYFSFTNSTLISQIIEDAKVINTLYGYCPIDKRFLTENFYFAFWAGDFGLAISAENLELYSVKGKIDFEQIPKINADWWEYWQTYWQLRETENALPTDYACEVTIPVEE